MHRQLEGVRINGMSTFNDSSHLLKSQCSLKHMPKN